MRRGKYSLNKTQIKENGSGLEQLHDAIVQSSDMKYIKESSATT